MIFKKYLPHQYCSFKLSTWIFLPFHLDSRPISNAVLNISVCMYVRKHAHL